MASPSAFPQVFLSGSYGPSDAKVSDTEAQLTACSSGAEAIFPPPRALAMASLCLGNGGAVGEGICTDIMRLSHFFSHLQTAGQAESLPDWCSISSTRHVTDQAGGKTVYETPWPSSHHFRKSGPQGIEMSFGVSCWERGKLEKLMAAREGV